MRYPRRCRSTTYPTHNNNNLLGTRLLSTLYNDDRIKNPLFHSQPLFSILESTHLQRLLKPLQIKAFMSGLSPHHLALLEDGSTVLERAVIEHNIFAVSKLYTNIGFDRLAEILVINLFVSVDLRE